MANILFDALIAPHANNRSPFLVCDDGTIVTYAAFVRRAAQMAHALVDAGARPGDRLVVQGPKTADAVALFAGALQAGIIYLPLNTAYTKAEVRYFLDDARPTVVVCDPGRKSSFQMTAPRFGEILTLAPEGSGTLATIADSKPQVFPTVPRGPEDLAALLYTSGTTGRSKGAMMSHKNLLSNAQALTDLWRIGSDDQLLHALPIFHTHGLFVALNTSLLAGAKVRLMARFDLDDIFAEMPHTTLMMGVPTFYTRMLSDPRLSAELCAQMRLFISGSAPLLAETHKAFADRTGHMILERYGMTETNMITSNPYDGPRIAGTVGYPLPGTEVTITQDGAPVAPNQIGMIEVRGDNVFQGYWGMPEKTKEEKRSNGFFITGDLGVASPDGRISIVGRQKDLIISGGYNVYPKEVEDVLNDIDGILETAVFGVPDVEFGETVVAAIVFEDDPLDSVFIADHVAKSLAAYKRPKRYVILGELPRNTMGKVQKATLRSTHSV